MPVLLVGANPGLTVASGGETVAFVSAWRVDWSPHGAGRVIVLWHRGRTEVLTDRPVLGRWLAGTFTRHFPEVDGLPWPEPVLTEVPVTMDLDLAAGCTATAGTVQVRLTDPSGHRLVTVESFPGNGFALSTVYAPCRLGELSLAGTVVPGTATGFLADAEVWSAP